MSEEEAIPCIKEPHIGYFSDPRRGIRATCMSCGWSGPWREGDGFALERDAEAHIGED